MVRISDFHSDHASSNLAESTIWEISLMEKLPAVNQLMEVQFFHFPPIAKEKSMKKNLSEIFKELNKPDNKLKMVIKLMKDQKTQEQKDNESESELSK